MATGEDVPDSRRNLVVDQDEFEEQFLRCAVCREKYDQNTYLPKSLPCNHTFCQQCLLQVFDHNTDEQDDDLWAENYREGMLKCPTCRVEIYITRLEINDLPSDHRIIQMIDFLSHTAVQTQNVCVKHERQPLNFFCKKCLLPICRDCTVLDHKEQDGHNIVDVSEGLTELSNTFDEVQEKTEKILDRLKVRTNGLANASKRLDLLEMELKNKIKDTFIEYRLLLEKRQVSLIKCVKEHILKQKREINSRFVTVSTEGNELQKLQDGFKKARTVKDTKQIFAAHQKIKSEESKFDDTANTTDDDLFVSCEFTNDSEGIFLSEISSLGEVKEKKDATLKDTVPSHQLVLLQEEDQRTRYVDEFFSQMMIEPEVDTLLRDDSDEVDRVMPGHLIERASVAASAERLAQRASAAVRAIRETQTRGSRRSRRERYRVARHPVTNQVPSHIPEIPRLANYREDG